MREPFQNAYVLTGPTASGKTALSLELAERLDAEIVSMDSMAVYRGMDIGTAKPTFEERRRISHHLLDVLDPWQSGNVAWWLERAAASVMDIEARGKRVLICGGTPMYLKALLYGLFDGPAASSELRTRLDMELKAVGPAILHARLNDLDPITAARVHANDSRRIIRALEVWEATGTPISSHQQQWQRTAGTRPDQVLCLDVPRAELYRRIDARVVQMIADGLIDEVRSLRRTPHGLSKEARQAVGLKEISEYLDGVISMADAIVRIQTRSRQFAKRQLSWFRQLTPCRSVAPELTFTLWTQASKSAAGTPLADG